MWSVSWHSKMLFHYVIGNIIVFSSCWCNAWLSWWLILASMSLFFLFFLFFSPKNYSSTFLFVDISTSFFIFFIFNFQSWPFYWSFICFQFYPSILIYQISYSSMWSSFFIFLNFIVCSFIRVLVVFNLIIQFKLMILIFKFGLCFFISNIFFLVFL
jgi:hypothetical protein